MRVIGLTGGVGSGKSFVADIICRNFPVLHVNTDNISRNQLLKGGVSYDGVVEAFGREILKSDGEVDRALLGSIVFNDAEKLKLLNSLTHPNVTKEVMRIIEMADKEEIVSSNLGKAEPYTAVMVETAILKEAGYIDFCDDIWYVKAPVEDRIRRIMTTRGYSLEKAESMLSSQASDEEFEAYCTGVLLNPDAYGEDEIVMQVKKFLY